MVPMARRFWRAVTSVEESGNLASGVIVREDGLAHDPWLGVRSREFRR